jgi:acyl carrier protein
MKNITDRVRELVEVRAQKNGYAVRAQKNGYAVPYNPDIELVALGFDSLNTVSLLLELEKVFSIEFPVEIVNSDTFKSVKSVADAVERLIKLS